MLKHNDEIVIVENIMRGMTFMEGYGDTVMCNDTRLGKQQKRKLSHEM